MKSLYLVLWVLIWPLAARAQGVVGFRNFDATTGLNAPVLRILDTSGSLSPASGTNFVVDILAGPSASSLKMIASTSFLSGSEAGYFDGGALSIPGVPIGGATFIQLRIYASAFASFAEAQAVNLVGTWGQFPICSVITGTSNTPAVLLPLNGGLFFGVQEGTVRPILFANYTLFNGGIKLISTGVLQVSADLVHWADVPGGTNSFPLNQPSQFFRARQ